MSLVLIIAVVIIVALLLLYLFSPITSPKPLKLDGSHVLVTGGSSGIGKAIAVDVVKRGASVTLLARDQKKLAEAKIYVADHCKDRKKQRIQCISVDLPKDYAMVEKVIKQAEENLGPIDMVVNCAGFAVAARFTDHDIDDFKRLMEVNYLGSVYATRAVVGGMKERCRGRVVLVSSQAGQLGLYGYTAYSASKFALRGLAEALEMEMKPYDVHVTLAFPADTDTPGLAAENVNKPEETKLISQTAGLFQAEEVAKTIVKDAVAGRFQCYIGLDGYMLSIVTSGFGPVTSLIEAIQQVLLIGAFRLVSLFYLSYFDSIVRKCWKKAGGASSDNPAEDNKSK